MMTSWYHNAFRVPGPVLGKLQVTSLSPLEGTALRGFKGYFCFCFEACDKLPLLFLAYFIEKVNSYLAKSALNFIGCLVKIGLTSLVKQTTRTNYAQKGHPFSCCLCVCLTPGPGGGGLVFMQSFPYGTLGQGFGSVVYDISVGIPQE